MEYYTPQEACKIHNLKELKGDDAQKMMEELRNLKNTWKVNNSWHILFVSEDGTRFIKADRKQNCYFDGSDEGYWKIAYGRMGWKWRKDVFGDFVPTWILAKTYSKSVNGTEIPKMVKSKKDVMKIVKAIGIFEI